ncbi:MAG: hypothetical protein ACR2FS_01805 [Phormidesmis sp.]
MRPTFLLKATSAVGLIVLLCTTLSTGVQRTAKAQTAESVQAGAACLDAYFENPNYSYFYPTDWSFDDPGWANILPADLSEEQRRAIVQASAVALSNREAVTAEVNTFSVELDAPFVYIANEVNDVAVEIPLEIKEAMDEAVNYQDGVDRREQVKMLNGKYGQYATFGQQITLVFSPEQAKRVADGFREYNAKVKNILTEEQKQATRDLEGSELVGAGVACEPIYGFDDDGTIVVETGQRPELDQRLREDTSNSTFFD